MKITFLFTGKTKIAYIEEGIRDYHDRLKHYVKTGIRILPDLKNTRNMSEAEQMRREGESILKELPEGNFIILMDEKGKKYNSEAFSAYLGKKLNEGRDLCIVIGGAWGFSDEVKQKGDAQISLSDMTFSHQMVRMILMEQVYRAFTIMKGEPYHHS